MLQYFYSMLRQEVEFVWMHFWRFLRMPSAKWSKIVRMETPRIVWHGGQYSFLPNCTDSMFDKIMQTKIDSLKQKDLIKIRYINLKARERWSNNI